MTASDLTLRPALVKLARALPKGSTFIFDVSAVGLLLKILRVPRSGEGVGSRFLAEVLASADAHGTPVRLQADPTDEPGDPDTLTLMRWYARFGFEPRRATDDGVWMERPVPVSPRPAEDVLLAADAARATVPSRAACAAWLDEARVASGATSGWRRPKGRP